MPESLTGRSVKTAEAQGADRGCTPKIALKVENGRILLSADALARLED